MRVDISPRFSFHLYSIQFHLYSIQFSFESIQMKFKVHDKNNDENQALNLITKTGKYGYERGEAVDISTRFSLSLNRLKTETNRDED